MVLLVVVGGIPEDVFAAHIAVIIAVYGLRHLSALITV
jgi:hypothetical protein